MYIHTCIRIRMLVSSPVIEPWFKTVLMPHPEFSSEVQTDTMQSLDSLGFPG